MARIKSVPAVSSFQIEAFSIALKAILQNKLRSFLTLIGIIVGVAAVIVVGASITGLKTYVVDRVSKLVGANHFMITRMAFIGRLSDDEFDAMNRRNRDVTWDEYEYLKEKCTSCDEIGAEVTANADIDHSGIEMPAVRVSGITANMADIEDKELTEGRFLRPEEIERGAMVTVIGTDVVEKFFSNSIALGQTIKIRGVPMMIVGVEAKRGAFLGSSLDRQIYIPITLHSRIFSKAGGISVHGKAADKEKFGEAIEEARNLLRNKRILTGNEGDNFGLVNFDDLNSQMDQITGIVAKVIIPITSIILMVGGIVVMNIMLVSVTERTFEIGLRKALGATHEQILLQFLIESLLLCILGCLLGLLLAISVIPLVEWYAEITLTVTAGYVFLSVAFSTIIGLVSGIYPAWKAACMDPIIALYQT